MPWIYTNGVYWILGICIWRQIFGVCVKTSHPQVKRVGEFLVWPEYHLKTDIVPQFWKIGLDSPNTKRLAVGDVKDNMTPKKEENKTAFGVIASTFRRRKPNDKADPENFCDSLMATQQQLERLIAVKQAELSAEKGREEYNRLALARLHTMAWHLEATILTAEEYAGS